MNFSKNILVTGGAGFIGCHVIKLLLNKYPFYRIINLDALTYAGNLENLFDVEEAPNYVFEKANILYTEEIDRIFEEYSIDAVIHLAAESHVDRSILSPLDFVYTNIIGTVNLLNSAKKYWKATAGKRFYHISTDEVYGSLCDSGFLQKQLPIHPIHLTLHPRQLPIIL